MSGFEKGPTSRINFSENLFLIAHNFWTVTAMNFRLGVNILQSLINTHCKLCAPPTSGMGVATTRVDCVRNRPFYASLQAFSALDRSLARLSNVGFIQKKAWSAYKPSQKSMALVVFVWWQLEKCQKFTFCAKSALFSNPLTYIRLHLSVRWSVRLFVTGVQGKWFDPEAQHSVCLATKCWRLKLDVLCERESWR